MKTEKILEKLIQINTIKDKENLKINKFLADLLLPLGFKIQYIKNKASGKENLLAKYNTGKKTVLTFSGHTDTVPVSQGWRTNPFQLRQKGNRFYGLGAGDMKGPIASILATVSQYDLQKLKKGINLVFTYGEEVDLRGVQEFLKRVKLKTKFIIVAEDTGLKPVVASKGAYAIKIEFFGKAAHGSEAGKGLNAICLAQDFTGRLKDYFEKIEKERDDLFAIPYATLNVAKICGGDLINRVPAYCCLECEYRTIAKTQGIKIYQNILKILRTMKVKFKINLTLQIQPMINTDQEYVKALEQITQEKANGSNFTTEASIYDNYGYSCIVLGPGNNMAHQPNEYISKEQLEKAEQIYKKIIQAYCH
ncbi:MAG: M20/M25/M40 family metallo-hydrolase [Candidatus Parcubacteria bacterium]|nr:M20/M25/M40 family metallo-hydrolase [Candidatus Parcubacteria bacterium]